jgi:predicted nucleotidyltransferase
VEVPDELLPEVAARLRAAGAVFAYLHGSVVSGLATERSDLDVAAWFGRGVDAAGVAAGLPDRVDVLVLDAAPLELQGRVALHGRLLFEQDPAARVAWEAATRKIYLDELPRRERGRADFVAAFRRG